MRRLALSLSLIAAVAASLSACVVAPVPTRVGYYEPAPRYHWGPPRHHRDRWYGPRGYRHGG